MTSYLEWCEGAGAEKKTQMRGVTIFVLDVYGEDAQDPSMRSR